MKIAIVGAGISGIAFGGVLRRFGHAVTLFEKAERVGGIWALAYPGVRLQNSREQYRFADFPWPETPDRHPTAAQILAYLEAAVAHFGLDVRLGRAVTRLHERDDGWRVETRGPGGDATEDFDFVVVSIGQYAEGKHRPAFPGEAAFRGRIVTERDVRSVDEFRGKRVAVVGFGKSAVDMASFAAPVAAATHHVFRTPRWLVPFRLLGVHFTHLMFPRATTLFMPCWVHTGCFERLVHERAAPAVRAFWALIEAIVRRYVQRHARGRGPDAAVRLARVTPTHGFVPDMRSATAMAPVDYFRRVAEGAIEPHHAELDGFTEDGLRLAGGEVLPAELVVLSLGSRTPAFPFMPAKYRERLEAEHDGVQLYRHLLHPDVPRLAFAGYNHGFMHVSAAEMGALWVCAWLAGDITLPDPGSMHRDIERVRAWKRANVQYEPSRSCAVSTRFQQHIDLLLRDLGLSPYRKLPNLFAEVFARYGGADYAGVVDAYRARRGTRAVPLRPLATGD